MTSTIQVLAEYKIQQQCTVVCVPSLSARGIGGQGELRERERERERERKGVRRREGELPKTRLHGGKQGQHCLAALSIITQLSSCQARFQTNKRTHGIDCQHWHRLRHCHRQRWGETGQRAAAAGQRCLRWQSRRVARAVDARTDCATSLRGPPWTHLPRESKMVRNTQQVE